jgi:hypothetical protein
VPQSREIATAPADDRNIDRTVRRHPAQARALLDRRMRSAWLIVMGCLVLAAPAYAKAPPSAFGEAYDESSASPPRGDDDDDALTGPSDRRPAKMPKVRRPNPNRRQKIMLDGGQGTRAKDREDEDMP